LDEQEPPLFGDISIPLFAFRRNGLVSLRLPLKQASATRRGIVNVSFGNLIVTGLLAQPKGNLVLPVEPPLPSDPATDKQAQEQPLNLADLEMQIGRIDALIQLIFVRWQGNFVYAIQWERPWFSLAWLAFMMVWCVLLWQWSLAILAVIFLKNSFDIWRGRRFCSQTDGLQGGIEPLPPGFFSGLIAESPGEFTARSATATPGTLSPDRQVFTDVLVPQDLVVWEAERRIVFASFSADYLADGLDLPVWTDDRGQGCMGPRSVVLHADRRFRYQWKVVVNESTDENGWQYAFAFTEGAEWRRTWDNFQTWVRRRQHHGRCVGPIEDPPSTAIGEAPPVEQERMRRLSSDFDGGEGGGGATMREVTLSENELFSQYIKLYLSIRNDVDFVVGQIEKYKNLLTWKDETVTTIIIVILIAVLVLSLYIPTRFVFAFFVGLTFYVGELVGRRKRSNRALFLDELSKWSSSVSGMPLNWQGGDDCSKLEEKGITRLRLRDWCNRKYKTHLNLRTVGDCGSLAVLADIVVFASNEFEKNPRRYRAWHSDFYTNFLDHVPSDAAEHDASTLVYKLPAGVSLPSAA